MGSLISVIIPVYNIEWYIERCIVSVITQTYRNIEVILVDDGSTDRSGEICDRYAVEDTRVRVIHQVNGGLSVARNTGIDASSGEYITFIDGDDFISNSHIEKLYELMLEGGDISACDCWLKYEDEKTVYRMPKAETVQSISAHTALKEILYQKNISNFAAWGKLYRRRLFADVRYPVGRYYEDVGTTYKLFLRADRVVCSSYKTYYYVQRSGSIVHEAYTAKQGDYLYYAKQMYETLQKQAPECAGAAASVVVTAAGNLMLQMHNGEGVPEAQRRQMYEEIVKHRKGLLFDRNIRMRNRLAIVLSWFPFAFFDFVAKQYSRLNRKTAWRKIVNRQ